jgi:hypothetical protein
MCLAKLLSCESKWITVWPSEFWILTSAPDIERITTVFFDASKRHSVGLYYLDYLVHSPLRLVGQVWRRHGKRNAERLWLTASPVYCFQCLRHTCLLPRQFLSHCSHGHIYAKHYHHLTALSLHACWGVVLRHSFHSVLATQCYTLKSKAELEQKKGYLCVWKVLVSLLISWWTIDSCVKRHCFVAFTDANWHPISVRSTQSAYLLAVDDEMFQDFSQPN